MNTLITKRIIIDLLLLISILNGWWLAAAIIAIIANWYLPYFIETIIAGIVHDSLFGYSATFGWAGYLGSIVGLIIFAVIEIFKNVLRR
jgi:hypothetical protein